MKSFYTTSKISENMHETPEGFLVCVGVPIARTGEMIYDEKETSLVGDESGRVVITRDENEVFDKRTMASFEGKPITITHPTEFVTPDNWARLAKGVVQNVRRGEGDQKNDLIADLLVTDSVAINLIKNGLREVSCGYEANYVQGDEDGEGKQTRIVGNHLALVDQGRAGSSYAINDHKRKGIEKMSIAKKISSIFAKTADEMSKIVDADMESKSEEKKSKDADEEKEEKSMDAKAMNDELVKMFDEMKSKMQDLLKMKDSKDADEDKDEEKKKDDSKDADEDDKKEAKDSLEDRLKSLEAAVKKLLEGKASDEDSEATEYDDADKDDMKSEDDDFEANTMTGDTKSRIEILAPGMKAEVKNAKAKALKKAYETADGKSVIDSLTGGKPTFDSKEKVETLFIAASEVLKAKRTSELSDTKKVSLTRDSVAAPFAGGCDAQKINEINDKFYKQA